MTTVTIDDALTCYGVHWNTSLANAEIQFGEWGFIGIHDLEKIDVMQGNDARRQAQAIAERQDAKFFFVGSYDASVGDDAAIYKFSYTAYDGGITESGDQWKNFAGYRPN